jgi:hypothetical protein
MGLLFLLALTVVLGLLMWGSIWAMNVAAARMVGDKHRLLQTIAETGEVPESWRRPYEARIARLRGKPGQAGRMAQVEQQAQQRYAQKLSALVRYVEKTTLVEDEEVRRMLLERLAEARVRWQAMTTDKRDPKNDGA